MLEQVYCGSIKFGRHAFICRLSRVLTLLTRRRFRMGYTCFSLTECLRLRLGVSISRMLCLHTACSQPAIGHQPSQPSRSAVWDRAMAGLLLFVDSFINRCYLLVSGLVRVRRGIVGRLGLGLALGLQLGIGIGFRHNRYD